MHKVKSLFRIFLLIIACLWIHGLSASPRIELNAILNNAAVLTINGKQQLLRLKQRSVEGYQLDSIVNDAVILLINGQKQTIKLGATIGSSRPAPINRVTLTKLQGMYFADGRINDQGVKFLIDTGASYVAINSQLAERLGIDYRNLGTPTRANTASGQVTAWRLTLSKVTVGSIVMQQVEAAVIEGSFPVTPLLGMSFLSRIQMQDTGSLLTLEQTF